MDISYLSPELQEKVKAAKTPEELFALAQEEGHELTDEELEAIAGGASDGWACESFECIIFCPIDA